MNRYATAAYAAAPIWAQNLMLTGFAALLDRQRYGGRFAEFKELLARTERYSIAEMHEYQNERLRDIVSHAYRSVPYYRRRFDALKLTPQDIKGHRDLPKLPLLTKHDIRRHFDELKSTELPKGDFHSGHTSGTTGTPLTIGYDRDNIWATYAVFDRHYRWAGLKLARDGDRIAVVRGNVIVPLAQKTPPFWRYNRQHNQMLLSSFHLSPRNLPAYLDAIEKFRPAVVDGYPSTLYVLAKFLESQGRTMPMRAAVTSSETLYDFQRDAIERQFECRVFDYYALAERVVFSGECERHEGHHVAMEYGISEVVDAAAVPRPAGAPGVLVGTSLHNKAMPLIRYATNDSTAMRAARCSCGRPHELMEDVTTKAEDMLTLPDGRLISPSVLTHPFKPLDSIAGSQIVQTAKDQVTVRLIAGPGFSAHLTEHLVHELQARLGEGVTIKVEMVDQLETSPNGKFKWVTSHIPLKVG